MILKRQISQKDGGLILKELCKRVGVDSKKFDFDRKDWYWKHTWSEEQQEDFRVWLGKFLEEKKYCKGNYRRGKIFMNHGYHEAGKLILVYGWKIKNENKA